MEALTSQDKNSIKNISSPESESPRDATSKVARGLGWFSIGLGVYELVSADYLGYALGMENKAALIRLYGLREIVAGIGILKLFNGKLAPWIWARIAGDALDIATLSIDLSPHNLKRKNTFIALGMVVGVTLLDSWCAKRLSELGR